MNKNACILGFDDRWFRIIGMPLVVLISPIVFFNDSIDGWDSYWRLALAGIVFTVFIWEGNRQIFMALTRRYPDYQDWKKRLKLLLLLCFLYTLAICPIINWGFSLTPFEKPHISQVAGYSSSYFTLLMVGAIYESIRFFQLWRSTTEEKEEVERAHLSSQLEGLRNQVNPHFLFNSLNTLTYLIPESPNKAVGFVRQLSKVYRYVLESRDTKVIPLYEELAFLDAFVYLLRERFGDNFTVDMRNLTPYRNMAIVPLSLQILLENAIKHNIISTEKPLYVEIFAENGRLVVRNNLQRKNQVMDSTGVGLENIKTRYRMLSGKEVEVIVSQQYFTVALPLIELQTV
ncbi:MAG: histidine kinase [Lewinellaceae bacterium]|nr:histidine kinase [Lewinella sp.]MCB9281235.1 histidine kinase [Lewinellaceae bacterium]